MRNTFDYIQNLKSSYSNFNIKKLNRQTYACSNNKFIYLKIFIDATE